MKNFNEVTKPTMKKFPKKVDKPKWNWKSKPQPLVRHEVYEDISRIFPSYVKDNYQYFELLSPPLQKITDWYGYIMRLKKKIACMKSDFSV